MRLPLLLMKLSCSLLNSDSMFPVPTLSFMLKVASTATLLRDEKADEMLVMLTAPKGLPF